MTKNTLVLLSIGFIGGLLLSNAVGHNLANAEPSASIDALPELRAEVAQLRAEVDALKGSVTRLTVQIQNPVLMPKLIPAN